MAIQFDPTGAARAAQASRRGERGAGTRTADFSRHLDWSEGAGGVSGGRPAAAVDSMLAIQQIGSEPDDEGQAKRRGQSLLDLLDELRREMLTGTIERRNVERLAGLVREQAAFTIEPRLRAVIDEIELRAAVELAKLERP